MPNGSTPLSSYPTKGDSEVIPNGLPTGVTSGSVVGDEANHSSQTASVDTSQGVQWDDDEAVSGFAPNTAYDPNMSGPKHSEPVQDVRAGQMSSFQDNDDYIDYMFDTSHVPLSRLLCDELAGFSTNGGYPVLPIQSPGSSDGIAFGSDSVSPEGEFGSATNMVGGISVSPIVRRS